MFDLVLDHLGRPLKAGPVGSFQLHDLDGVADRGQRIAELMGEHGEELVLALVGVFEGFDGSLEFGDVADDPGEDPADTQPRLADGQLHRENGAILAEPAHLANRADDLLSSGPEIFVQVMVVLAALGLGHSIVMLRPTTSS